MSEIMIDLETMGVGPNAAIVAIGAVHFDMGGGGIIGRFYRAIELESSVLAGGTMDASTVLWWMRRKAEARDMIQAGVDIEVALLDLSRWMDGFSPIGERYVWGNGAAFDNVILASAYRNSGIQQPWYYHNERCYRTVRAMYPEVKFSRIGVYHNAVDDAESQALHLIDIFKEAMK